MVYSTDLSLDRVGRFLSKFSNSKHLRAFDGMLATITAFFQTKCRIIINFDFTDVNAASERGRMKEGKERE